MKRALISVSDKTGILELVEQLIALDFEIISTGGTKTLIAEAGLPVIGIEEVTEFPEMLDGRVKTLHPAIHGGLLARRDDASHMAAIAEHNIALIDLVIVNLYPFQETITQPDVALSDAIENIDIGGPSMLRSAAKNHASVTVIADAADYEHVLAEYRELGDTTFATRQRLAAKVFRHTAAYDALIAGFLTEVVGEEYPEKLTLTYNRKQALRYGENPHQSASFYAEPIVKHASLVSAEQLHGKELSYNNIRDADAALHIVQEFETECAVVAVKHMNPCGVGLGETIEQAFLKAYEADPTSIFGGVLAFNREIDLATAQPLSDMFLELLIAPSYSAEALALLSKKKNIRLLKMPIYNTSVASDYVKTSVAGGLLVQQADEIDEDPTTWEVVTTVQPTTEQLAALAFQWKVVKHIKSNAIVIGDDSQTVGVGAGQMNRVGSAKIAFEQAGDRTVGAVMASDAFFPMPDTIEEAAKVGIVAIVQPGGSMRDQESIDEANKHGISMVFTKIRHFKH
ncbi:bifunctional phosphoribosylaminoimidazolecarboxamide formyltransferase/IMP cyclohydrolase [Brochothrix thermosphacta]|uniref:Bifunctional purine biosynthesis protein PurH n=1 Tax=Brochothrix thermosphacta TaxID=2756 RepID=A0A1D2KN07_BROTH|nr:bifunctional phosphoribosylaminoimidazolecarboxamide formyltransferase/IMP cyclohydrolase [Brochothrix thermosphacta]SLM95533.1 IMP cyclohydrolase / Phosphoribosylaminoimidazolecarboxamide formyltransferase [Brachybacterium faecium]ANZ94590.1 bifunctional phosphoribosylaminoimidazolecarboxamide formyltransferase/IMP cyclohydrolase [Brochothrix thermosphacta]ANZ97099.1 bifunctional phosphoribosylaminoimidazolecarboxamide formyltransferase/IMP cyclohydrolase [Brochothrix thermosphacta]ATF26524